MALNVAFLWHMHQPYYVDTCHGTALMPWVRFHATKGYLDMIWLVEQFPEFRCTFNLTPVLLKQIEQLAHHEVRDLWYELATTPAAELTLEQKSSILEHFFKANWDNMVKPFPRYWALLHKRGVRPVLTELPRLAGSFSEQDWRDLQVWYNLTWFGYAGEKLYPEIAELKRKGQGFTETDKHVLFEQQADVLQNLLSYYRALAERGQIEISTTPFYHPIMPLVHNTEFARRCMPGVQLPPAFAHPEDVRAQLQLARDYQKKLFGVAPHGIWPSEGSVYPELIPILQDLGFEWFATDEEILWRSLATLMPGDTHDRSQLFRGYRARFGDASAGVAFRERTLSDFVGFTAARNDPKRAAEFMVGHLETVARSVPWPDGLCPVILDGENAWEHFPDGGEAFLRELYGQISRHGEFHTTTFHDHFTSHPPQRELPTLATGSWINANFRIWIGHPEDNRGWDVLGRTRDFLFSKINRGELTPEQRAQALDEIYAAEGSDWFWWYGDDFVTDNDIIFDELFRTHLQNVYRIAGAPVPDFLRVHICRSEISYETRRPTELITPTIDGQLTSFYEWAGAGVYEAGRAMGAMYRTERHVASLQFGTDRENFYLRVDFRQPAQLPASAGLRVTFLEPCPLSIVIPHLSAGSGTQGELWKTTDSTSQKITDLPQIAFRRILELGVPFSQLNWHPRDKVAFFIQLLDQEVELERHPDLGAISLTIPSEDFEAENWWV